MHEGEDEGVPKKQMVQRDNSQRKRELRRSEEEANSVRPQHFFDAEKGRTEMVCQSFALSVYCVCVCVCVCVRGAATIEFGENQVSGGPCLHFPMRKHIPQNVAY